MAGSVSPTQIIAADGFLKNSGLGVNSTLTQNLELYQNLPLVSQYSGMISALNGAAVSLPWMPSFLSNLDPAGASITGNITSRATNIAGNTKVLINTLTDVTTFCDESFSWYASATEVQTKTFDDYGLAVDNYTDLVSGGVAKIFVGKNNVADLSKLSSILRKFGKLYNPQVGLYRMFSPTGFYENLVRLGLGNIGNMQTIITLYPKSVLNDDQLMLEVLAQITSVSDLQKVITQTGVELPTNTVISSLADFVNAAKVVPYTDLSTLPDGTLDGFENAILNLGGSFNTCSDIADLLDQMSTTELSNLDTYQTPLPTAIFSTFTANLGAGSGPFGNPTVNDLIGTAAGHVHNVSYNTIIDSHTTIYSSQLGSTLSATVIALASDPTNVTKKSDFVAAQTALLSTSNVKLSGLLTSCNSAINSTLVQLAKEINNCAIAGIDVSIAVMPTYSETLGMASRLHTFGEDQSQTKVGEFLINCATNSAAGDAVTGAIHEGLYIKETQNKGILSTVKSDPQLALALRLQGKI